MSNPNRYCTSADLVIGDIGVVSGDRDRFVNLAADEIDAELGFVYQVPIDVSANGATPHHVKLLLKKINYQLASGRLLLSAASAESDAHAYGLSLVNEARGTLLAIRTGQTDLTNVPRNGGATTGTGPRIIQGDAVSAVDAFYNPNMPPSVGGYVDFWRPGA